jgi:hypothetical protein
VRGASSLQARAATLEEDADRARMEARELGVRADGTLRRAEDSTEDLAELKAVVDALRLEVRMQADKLRKLRAAAAGAPLDLVAATFEQSVAQLRQSFTIQCSTHARLAARLAEAAAGRSARAADSAHAELAAREAEEQRLIAKDEAEEAALRAMPPPPKRQRSAPAVLPADGAEYVPPWERAREPDGGGAHTAPSDATRWAAAAIVLRCVEPRGGTHWLTAVRRASEEPSSAKRPFSVFSAAFARREADGAARGKSAHEPEREPETEGAAAEAAPPAPEDAIEEGISVEELLAARAAEREREQRKRKAVLAAFNNVAQLVCAARFSPWSTARSPRRRAPLRRGRCESAWRTSV